MHTEVQVCSNVTVLFQVSSSLAQSSCLSRTEHFLIRLNGAPQPDWHTPPWHTPHTELQLFRLLANNFNMWMAYKHWPFYDWTYLMCKYISLHIFFFVFIKMHMIPVQCPHILSVEVRSDQDSDGLKYCLSFITAISFSVAWIMQGKYGLNHSLFIQKEMNGDILIC